MRVCDYAYVLGKLPMRCLYFCTVLHIMEATADFHHLHNSEGASVLSERGVCIGVIFYAASAVL